MNLTINNLSQQFQQEKEILAQMHSEQIDKLKGLVS
jgi:hypothetical protein